MVSLVDIFYVLGHELDSEQKRAVLCDTKYVLLLALAGSGKTMTIVGKIRYLIEVLGISEEEILCLSFTNNTVLHLKKILLDYGYNLPVYTFHKLALDIIKDYKEMVIANESFLDYFLNEYFEALILEDISMMKMVLCYFKKYFFFSVENVYKRFYSDNKKAFFVLKKIIKRVISLFKANNYDKTFFDFVYNSVFLKDKVLVLLIYKVYLLYDAELKSSGMVDFDDMISLAIDIISKYGMKKKYRYVIVDEFQDTSLLRFKLITSILNYCNCCLFAVGDDFQSIYRFSGCDLNIFLNFQNYFPNPDILFITNTYRNSQELIDIAGAFIMKN